MTITYKKSNTERTFIGLQEGNILARVTTTKEPNERGIKNGKIVLLTITDEEGIILQFKDYDFTHIAARRTEETQKLYTKIVQRYN